MKKSIVVFGVLLACLTGFKLSAQHRDVVVVKLKSHRNVVYVEPAPKVRVVRVMPPETRIIRYQNVSYYVHAGLYYHFIGGRYVVVAPPRGLRISILPPNYFYFQLSGIN